MDEPREDFMTALDTMIEDFADDPGISDEEIVAALEAKAADIRLGVRAASGLEVV